MTVAEPRPVSLWRNRNFSLLFAAAAVSELGSAVTDLALPLVAVLELHASTFQVGVLTGCSTAAFLLIALPAGVLVDRRPKRTLMLTADLSRAVLLASVPVAAALHRLSMGYLFVIALVVGLLSVIFDVAYQSYLPAVVSRERLVAGNARMGLPAAFAEVIGPTIGGVLVATAGAARALAVDAASFFGSCGALLQLRVAEPVVERPDDGRRLRQEMAVGLRYVAGHRTLRRVVACTATSNLFNSMRLAVIMVFLVRYLHARPAQIGLVLSIGSVGGLIGGLAAPKLIDWCGGARVLWLSKAAAGPTQLLIPFAGPGAGIWLVSVAMFFGSLSTVLYNVAQVSYRQLVCPPDLLGRMNASIRWVIWGVMPLGAVTAGWAAGLVGVRTVLLIAVLGAWSAVLWIVFSPMVRGRDFPIEGTAGSAA